jgi:hypothetical protein
LQLAADNGNLGDPHQEIVMRRTLTFLAVLTFAAGLAGAASAQKIDASGKCHDAKGKFAKMEVCKTVAPAAPAKCRDMKTKKFEKCGAPGAEAVPAKK